MTLSPRARWALRLAGYVVLALVTFVVALHLTFPYDRLRDRAIETLSNKYDVTISGVERSWMPGRFSLTGVTLRSRAAVVGQPTTTMYFKRVEIDLAFLPLLGSKVEIGLDISTGAGSITGTITQHKTETAIDFTLRKVPLATLPGISDAVGLPMAGNGDGKIRLKIAKNDWSKANGVFELACSVGCTVGDGISKIYPKSKRPGDDAWSKDGIPVPPLRIQSFKLAIDLVKGEAKRRTFVITSTDGEVDIDFDIKLSRTVMDSTIAGCIKYKCSKELYDRERSFRVTCDLGSPIVDGEGFHHVKLMGKLSNVRRIGALCDGQADHNGDPLSATGNERPRLDLPIAEPIQPIDAGVPELDASVAPPPVDPSVRPHDDVPPPTADELRMEEGRTPQPPPTGQPPIIYPSAPVQPEGVSAPQGGVVNGAVNGAAIEAEPATPPPPAGE